MPKDYGQLLQKLQERRGPVTVDPEHMKMFGLSEDAIAGLLDVETMPYFVEGLSDAIEEAYEANTGVRAVIDQDMQKGTDEFVRHLMKFIRTIAPQATNESLKIDLAQKSLQIAREVSGKVQSALRPTAAPEAPEAPTVAKKGDLLTEEEAQKYFGTSLDRLGINIKDIGSSNTDENDISNLVVRIMKSRKKIILQLSREERRDLLLKLFRTIKDKKATTVRQVPDQQGGVTGIVGLTRHEKQWLGDVGDDRMIERRVDHILDPRMLEELLQGADMMTPEERAEQQKKFETSSRIKHSDLPKVRGAYASNFLGLVRDFLKTIEDANITLDRTHKIRAALEETLPTEEKIVELQAPLKEAVKRSGLKKSDIDVVLRQDPETQFINSRNTKDELSKLDKSIQSIDEAYRKEQDPTKKTQIKKEYGEILYDAKRVADLYERAGELQPLVTTADEYIHAIDDMAKKFYGRWVIAESFQKDLDRVTESLNRVMLSFKKLSLEQEFRNMWNIPGYLKKKYLEEKVQETEGLKSIKKLAAADSEKTITSVMKNLSKLLEDLATLRGSLIKTLGGTAGKILRDVSEIDPSHEMTIKDEEGKSQNVPYSKVFNLEGITPEDLDKMKMETVLEELQANLEKLRATRLQRFYTKINDRFSDLKRIANVIAGEKPKGKSKEKTSAFHNIVLNKLRDIVSKMAATAERSRSRGPSTKENLYDNFYSRKTQTKAGQKNLPDFFLQDSTHLVEKFIKLLEDNGVPAIEVWAPGSAEKKPTQEELKKKQAELEKMVDDSLKQLLHIPGGFEDWVKNRPQEAMKIDRELARLAKSKEERAQILSKEFEPVKKLQDKYVTQMESLIKYITDPLEKLEQEIEAGFSEAKEKTGPRKDQLKEQMIGLKDLVNKSKEVKDAHGVALFEKMRAEPKGKIPLTPSGKLSDFFKKYSSRGKSLLSILGTKEGQPPSNAAEKKFLEDLNVSLGYSMAYETSADPEAYLKDLRKLEKSDPESYKKHVEENLRFLHAPYDTLPAINEIEDLAKSVEGFKTVKEAIERVIKKAESTYEKDESPIESIVEKGGKAPETEEEKEFLDNLNSITGRVSQTLPTKKEIGELCREQVNKSKNLSADEKKFIIDLNNVTGQHFVELPTMSDIVSIHGGMAQEYREGVSPAEEKFEMKSTALGLIKDMPADIKRKMEAIPGDSRKKYEAIINRVNEKRKERIDTTKEYFKEIADAKTLVDFGNDLPELATEEPSKRITNGIGVLIGKLEAHAAEYKSELKPVSEAERAKRIEERKKALGGTFRDEVVKPVESLIDLQNRLEIDDFLYSNMRPYTMLLEHAYKKVEKATDISNKEKVDMRKSLDEIKETTNYYGDQIEKMNGQVAQVLSRLAPSMDLYIDSTKRAIASMSAAKMDLSKKKGVDINTVDFLDRLNIYMPLKNEVMKAEDIVKEIDIQIAELKGKQAEKMIDSLLEAKAYLSKKKGTDINIRELFDKFNIDITLKNKVMKSEDIVKELDSKIAELTDQLKMLGDLSKRVTSMKESHKSYLETQIGQLKLAAVPDSDDKDLSPAELAIEHTESPDLNIKFRKPEFLRVLNKTVQYFKNKKKSIENWIKLKEVGAVKGEEYRPEEHEEKYYKHFFGDLSMYEILSEITKVLVPGLKMLLKQKALPEGSKYLLTVEESVDKIEELLNTYASERTQAVNRHKEEFKKYVDETVRAEMLERYLEPDPKDPSKMTMKKLSDKEVEMLKRMYLQQVYRYMDYLWSQKSGQNIGVWGPRDEKYYDQVWQSFRNVGGMKSNKVIMGILNALKADVRADESALTGVRYKSQQLEEELKKMQDGLREHGMDPSRNVYVRDLEKVISGLKEKEKSIKRIFDNMMRVTEAKYISDIREGLRMKLETMPEGAESGEVMPVIDLEKKKPGAKKKDTESKVEEHSEYLVKKEKSVLEDLEEESKKEVETKADVDTFLKRADAIRFRFYNILNKTVTDIPEKGEKVSPVEKSAYTKNHRDFNLRILYGSEMQRVIAEMLSQSMK